MSLRQYQDFLELTTGQLKDYLTVRGVTTTNNRKVELIANAFAAMDMGLGFVASSEEQKKGKGFIGTVSNKA